MGRILLIDDAEAFLLVTQRALQAWGHNVTAVCNGVEGLEAFDREPPELVLVDLAMPGMDGRDVIRGIRQHPEGPTVPIIVLTANTREADTREALQAGAQACLIKARYSLKELRQCVEQCLESGTGTGLTCRRGFPGAGALAPECAVCEN